jgi:hypothetical protein
MVLLQVDESRSPMTGFGEQIETVDLALAQENPSTAPADAAVDHRLAAAEAVEATATGLVDAIVRHGPAGVRLSEESAEAANLPPTSRG